MSAHLTFPDDRTEARSPFWAPTRHGSDPQGAREMTRRLRWLMPEVGEPDGRAWQDMGQALRRGDPLADAVASWMLEQGGARMWPRVEAWLKQGPDAEQAGPDAGMPPPVRDLLRAAWQWPAWADPRLVDAGAQALHGVGLHGMRVLRDAGLMAGYQLSAVNQTLLRTGALQQGAQRRVAHTTAWWLAVTELGGMRPGGEGHLHTLQVRVMHALVRQRLLRDPQWDGERWGVPVNQLDMQATYLAFSVVHVVSLATTGLWLTAAQREAVMHLWRVIGWYMGVEDGLLCRDEAAGRRALVHNLLTQSPADEGSVQLARALMDEPLHRHYPNLNTLRGRFNRARHLSQVRWFVGAPGMAALGLPATLPWYPVLCLLPLAVQSALTAASPGLHAVMAKAARARQRRYLRVLLGD